MPLSSTPAFRIRNALLDSTSDCREDEGILWFLGSYQVISLSVTAGIPEVYTLNNAVKLCWTEYIDSTGHMAKEATAWEWQLISM